MKIHHLFQHRDHETPHASQRIKGKGKHRARTIAYEAILRPGVPGPPPRAMIQTVFYRSVFAQFGADWSMKVELKEGSRLLDYFSHSEEEDEPTHRRSPRHPRTSRPSGAVHSARDLPRRSGRSSSANRQLFITTSLQPSFLIHASSRERSPHLHLLSLSSLPCCSSR